MSYDDPRHATITDAFDAQAAATPNAIAVDMDRHRWSYRELRGASALLAARLRAAGVAPGDRVGIAHPPSVAVVAWQLAVLRLGAVFVPLRPGDPPARLLSLVQRAGLHAIAGPAALGDALGAVVPVLADEPDPEAGDRHVPPSPITSDDAAYVMFTSGSTGEPKGVEVTHANFLSFIDGTLGSAPCFAEPTIASGRWSALLSPAFDFSLFEVFGALLRGGTVVPLFTGAPFDPEVVADHCAAGRIDVITATPTMYRAIAPHLLRRAVLAGPRVWVLGGEAIYARDCVAWFERPDPAPEFINVYGPTEATVVATTHDVGAAARRGVDLDVSVIGRPIAGTTTTVVDGQGRPCAPGEPGELLIGGAGVSRGYVGDPERTAERFLPDGAGGLLYRTGDAVVARVDGVLEYHGRGDRQVKVRGFRLELGEVEAALRATLGDARCIVCAVEDAGSTVLEGYVHRDALGPHSDARVVRAALGDVLPDYMVPSRIVVVAELPQTANGKVDHDSLAREVAARTEAAHDPHESGALIVELWRELLGIEEVDPADTFFDLGGDSMLLLELRTRLAERGFRLELQEAFESPTASGMAAILRPSDVEGATPGFG